MDRDEAFGMKQAFHLSLLATAVLLATTTLVGARAAQAPQDPQSANALQLRPAYAAPTNLKVLPSALSGEQVHELMEQWQAALGTQCNSCHAEDHGDIGPDGRPLLKFADDSKPMKKVARTMYLMTKEINSGYLAKIDSSGVPVTCGTCHRGHLGPEPFSAAPDGGLRAAKSAAPPADNAASQQEHGNQ